MKRNNVLIALAIYIGLSSGTSFCAQPSRFSYNWLKQGASSAWQTVSSPFNALTTRMEGWSTRQLLTFVGTGLALLITWGIISSNTKVGTLIPKTKEPHPVNAYTLDEIIQHANNILRKGINKDNVSEAAIGICQRTKKLMDSGHGDALTDLDIKMGDKIDSVDDGAQKDRYLILQELFKNAHEYLTNHPSNPSFNLDDMKTAIISEKVNELIEKASKKYPAQKEATLFEEQ